jgi:hypothetical protein
MRISPLRSVVAVAGGVLLLGFMDSTLERTLVSAIAQGSASTEAAYLAIRNRPAVLAITLATHALASTLAGYIIAKIAGVYEVRHAVAAAVLLSAGYASTLMTVNAMLPPVWVRAAMLIITTPALVAGAHVRAEARAIQAEPAAPAAPAPEGGEGASVDTRERR